jgi:hypothetical protein
MNSKLKGIMEVKELGSSTFAICKKDLYKRKTPPPIEDFRSDRTIEYCLGHNIASDIFSFSQLSVTKNKSRFTFEVKWS